MKTAESASRARLRILSWVKTIYVLRHAKSDWDSDAPSDFERPLNRRGVQAAAHVGRFLAANDEVPDRVLTSSAVRAASTVELAAEAGAWRSEIVQVDSLYGASSEHMLEVLRGAPEGEERVMLVSHEPGISVFVRGLIGGASLRFPTAALARIDSGAGSWRDVAFGAATLRWLVVPRTLAGFARGLGG